MKMALSFLIYKASGPKEKKSKNKVDAEKYLWYDEKQSEDVRLL